MLCSISLVFPETREGTMKTRLATLTTLLAAAALALSACQPAPPPENPAPAAPHNLILYYHGDHTDALRREIAAYGAEILYHYPNLHGFAIRIPANKTLEAAEAHFSRLPNINGVARDQIQQLQ